VEERHHPVEPPVVERDEGVGVGPGGEEEPFVLPTAQVRL
jgi:hypothetical protein